MKYSQTVAGLLVVALIGLAVYWVRARQPGAAQSTAAEAALPDITRREGVARAGDVMIAASLVPSPPAAYAIFTVRIRAEAHGAPAPVDRARISFDMAMPMGEHRYTLVPALPGTYTADVTLPTCPTGSPRWFAVVEGTAAGQPFSVRFRFDLAPPK